MSGAAVTLQDHPTRCHAMSRIVVVDTEAGRFAVISLLAPAGFRC
jgi:hypothetical protein